MNARLVSVAPPVKISKKQALLETLRELLCRSFELRRAGGAHAQLTQAQGYADGYMRALLETGVVAERELLAFVVDVRRGVEGPATASLRADGVGELSSRSA